MDCNNDMLATTCDDVTIIVYRAVREKTEQRKAKRAKTIRANSAAKWIVLRQGVIVDSSESVRVCVCVCVKHGH
eukprot:4426494-Amphidinium_carterae.2